MYIYDRKLSGSQSRSKEQPITSQPTQRNPYYRDPVVSGFLGREGSSSTYVWESEGLGELSSAESEASDTTLANDRIEIHPDYNTDEPGKAPDIWKHSDKVRVLIERKGDPDKKDREELASAVVRQLRTVVLYGEVLAFFQAVAKHTNPSRTMSLYVVLFPGEAKDNTGIKDLNDKVLGYQLNGRYIQRRQQELSKLFWDPGDKKFRLVGQDYKTASILTLGATREEFAKRLAELDSKLRAILLNEILPEAERDAKKRGDKERLAEIQKLRRTLEKDKNYRFDIFFGLSTVEPKGSFTNTNAIDIVFLLVTEALKGAGIAKFIAKGMSLKTKVARGFVKDIKADGRTLDARGKKYEPQTYLTTSMRAGDIKALMTKKPSRDNPADYYSIYVDTVWTVSFIKYRRWFIGNPHVIRDVRKKALEPPPMSAGIKYTFKAQKEMIELWLVVLNMLDFVKDFLTGEFRQELVRYHVDARAVFWELRRFAKIDWPKLERVLTRDLRQTQRIAVLGTASEFRFYSFAADYSERIFFCMDIRDLGVALMLLYERANEEIEDKKPTGVKLMEETFRSSDPINEQRRFTYDRVVDTFRKYYYLVGKRAAVKVAGEARKAFGTGMRTTGGIPEFSKCVQFLLGGDEVFVAAHPYFEPFVHMIISDLDKTPLKDGTLNVRAAIAYSQADEASGPAQREKNQVSHHQAMTLTDQAPSILKQLERTHRRIERLIEKLEANPKKKDLAPPYRKELENLRLLKLFARVNHGKPKVMTAPQLNRLLRLFKAGNIRAAEETGNFELVDFSGNVVNGDKLTKDAAKLEEIVRRKVGTDNTHVDPPPVTKLPKWLEKLLDCYVEPDKCKL